MISILIADDHAIVRRGLRALLNTESGFDVIGETDNGHDVVTLYRELHPDVVLLDLVIPGQDGQDALEQIRVQDSAARVLILTSYSENERILAAVRAGAAGYLLKDASPEHLLQAIQDVYNGNTHIHPTIALKMLRDFDSSFAPPAADKANFEPLTGREIGVLKQVAQGYSNSDISKTLGISDRTVGNHIGSILRKLQLTNRTQAALYALQRGLVELQTDWPAGLTQAIETLENKPVEV
jgi:two-component system, NarL family, response regulator LiaR